MNSDSQADRVLLYNLWYAFSEYSGMPALHANPMTVPPLQPIYSLHNCPGPHGKEKNFASRALKDQFSSFEGEHFRPLWPPGTKIGEIIGAHKTSGICL